jgi:hypothetical protein
MAVYRRRRYLANISSVISSPWSMREIRPRLGREREGERERGRERETERERVREKERERVRV